jgi:hypothetical protein
MRREEAFIEYGAMTQRVRLVSGQGEVLPGRVEAWLSQG